MWETSLFEAFHLLFGLLLPLSFGILLAPPLYDFLSLLREL